MTNNQIQYLKYVEDKRSNLARETETNRDNLGRLGETQRYNTLSTTETGRSNRTRETETNRSNLANEDNTRLGLAINAQHYANQDSVAYQIANESARHNIRNENIAYMNYQTENRYKDRMAGTAEEQASAATRNAVTNQYNAGTNARNANYNAQNAESNTLNAGTNYANMLVNQGNAATNALNAQTNAAAQISQEKLNKAKRKETYLNMGLNSWKTWNGAVSEGIDSVTKVGRLIPILGGLSK